MDFSDLIEYGQLSMDNEDHDDFAAFDSHASVASSEWGNVSSSSSTSSPENQLSAKDIVNWQEFWQIWSSSHRLFTTTTQLPTRRCFSQDIYAIFQLANRIPRSWFSIISQHVSDHLPRLQEYLSQVAQVDSELFGEDDFNLSFQPSPQDVLTLAANALDIYDAVLRLSHDQLNQALDEPWTEIHDALILRCARGHLLGESEVWSLPPHTSYLEDSPIATRILTVQKVRPRGAVPIFPQDEGLRAQQPIRPLSAAAFSTRSQIASHLRDTPESVSLHSFNVMATSAILSQLNSSGIDMPVFGALFDRNVVRFHIDQSVESQEHNSRELFSLPLPGLASPFRDFDLTRPDDVLRVAFILAGIHSYAENRLAPAVLASGWNPGSRKVAVPATQGEITSEEKVYAWMQHGAVDDTEDPDLTHYDVAAEHNLSPPRISLTFG